MESVVDWVGTLLFWAVLAVLFLIGGGTEWLIERVRNGAVRKFLYIIVGTFNVIFIGFLMGGVMGEILKSRADSLAKDHGQEVIAYAIANPIPPYMFAIFLGMSLGFWWRKKPDVAVDEFVAERTARLSEGSGAQNDALWSGGSRRSRERESG